MLASPGTTSGAARRTSRSRSARTTSARSIALTNDRCVVGVMNEFAETARLTGRTASGVSISARCAWAQMPLGPPRNRSGFPDRELAAVVGGESALDPGHRVSSWRSSVAPSSPFDPEAFDPGEFDDNLRNGRRAPFDDEA